MWEPPPGLGGGTPLALLHLPPAAVQAVSEAAATGEPGVSTVRVAAAAASALDDAPLPAALAQWARELEAEVGFVCKRCRLCYPGEAALLAHQRVACYPGEAADARGVVRLARRCYECKACGGERAASTAEFRRHCESEAHQARLRAVAAAASSMPPPPPAASPSAGLTHEMEDVVNQITMLAAQNNTDSNANIRDRGGDFCAAAKMAPPLALSTAGP